MDYTPDKIITYTGKMFDPSYAKEEDIDIKDIAHALSLMTRANGHIPHFYSVASHCLGAVDEGKARGYTNRQLLLCLLHDADEAYISDITRPVKRRLELYKDIEGKLQTVIYTALTGAAPSDEEQALIDQVDDACLFDEFKVLTGYEVMANPPKVMAAHDYTFKSFEQVEKEYIKTFIHLAGKI